MAKGYSKETVGVLDGTKLPASKADGRVYGARHRRYRATFDFTQSTVKGAVGDTNVVLKRPAATAFSGGVCRVSATLGTTTIAIGTATNPTKYMAAQTLTAANAAVAFGNVAAITEAPLADPEEVIITIGVAAIAAGTLVVDFDTLAR